MYSTPADLAKLLPEHEIMQLTDDPRVNDINDPVIQGILTEAIDQADREIDGFVGCVRSIPLDPVPALITNISSKLAGHYLWLRRPGVDEPEPWREETKYMRRLLQLIAEGKLAIGPEEGGVAEAQQATVWATSGARQFMREGL